MGILLKNGTVVNAKGEGRADILVENGIVSAVGKDLEENGHEVVDVSGKYVLPGIIDVHVHFRDSGIPGGFEYKEDWASGSMSAAAGGITSAIDMPNTKPVCSTAALLEKKRSAAKGKSIINYGFHIAGLGNNASEIASAKNYGAVKVQMGETTGIGALDDESVLNAFRAAAKAGRPAFIHAYTPKPGEDDYGAGEKEAIERAAMLATKAGCALHICHCFSKEGVEAVRAAKRENGKITAETCPHYLVLNREWAEERGGYGKVNPPLGERKDNEALWSAVADGTIDVVSSDHAPHLRKEKEGPNPPSGMPGVQTMLPVMIHHSKKRGVALSTLVRLLSANPASLLGLEGRGFVDVGAHADLTVVDLSSEREARDADILSKCGWTPYAGMMLGGWPTHTFVGGNPVFSAGKINKIPAGELVFGKC